MRDLLFSQAVMGGFPLKFQYHQKLETETLKIDSYETKNLLFYFLVPPPLISSDQMIIGYLLM